MPGILEGLEDQAQPQGLLTPVIWDRLRNQQTLNPYTTEGAGTPYVGGSEARAPTKFVDQWNGTYAKTPSGHTVEFNGNLERPNVEFSSKGAYPGDPFRFSGGQGRGSTQRAIDTFSEVGNVLDDYIAQYQPKGFNFTALTDSHKALYDRLAPLLADRYNGTLRATPEGAYQILLNP